MSIEFLVLGGGGILGFLSAVNKRGRERKGPPEINQKYRLRKWPISSADFPMTPMERAEHYFGSFWEKEFGTISGGPLFSRPIWFTADSGGGGSADFIFMGAGIFLKMPLADSGP